MSVALTCHICRQVRDDCEFCQDCRKACCKDCRADFPHDAEPHVRCESCYLYGGDALGRKRQRRDRGKPWERDEDWWKQGEAT